MNTKPILAAVSGLLFLAAGVGVAEAAERSVSLRSRLTIDHFIPCEDDIPASRHGGGQICGAESEEVGAIEATLTIDDSRTILNGQGRAGDVVGSGRALISNTGGEQWETELTCVLDRFHWVDCTDASGTVWVGSNINFLEFFRVEVVDFHGVTGYTALNAGE
jgi:hypothetical protein